MCGFAGAIDERAGTSARSVIEAMTECLAHRGPDGAGIEIAGPLALGHRRLRVLDLSAHADQPFWNEERDRLIAFNGEVYNFRELRRDLEREGVRFRTESDTEVVLELFAREGEASLAKLDGMFAFAVWDAREEKLFLARDRSGKKPLYYFDDGRRLVFGSEIKALLLHPDVPRRPNLEALPLYLTYGYFPAPSTSYAEVKALPPATWMSVELRSGRRETRRYWRPSYEVDGIRRLPEAVERLKPLVSEAVRKRLLSDVPLGAFLSGGLDSTVVVALMRQASSKPVRTFSIGFEGAPEYDELAYAEEAARRYGCEHTSFRVAPPEPELLETLVHHHDGAFGDSSAIPTYIVSRLARENVTVALNGDGGDEVFCGYSRLAAAALAERVPPAVWRAAAVGGRLLPAPRSHAGRLRRLRQFLDVSASPLRERIQAWCSFFRTKELESILPGGGGDAAGSYFEHHLGETDSDRPLAKLLYLNYVTYLPEDLLVKMDRMTMAHGLEARSPLLDTALTEFAGTLPDAFKTRGLSTKVVLREAFRDLVPRSILERGKMGFGVPLGKWFRTEWKPLVEAHLVADRSPLFEHLRRDAISPYVDEHLAGRRDHGQKLFCLLTLSIWLDGLSR